jgi:hypothetical protein
MHRLAVGLVALALVSVGVVRNMDAQAAVPHRPAGREAVDRIPPTRVALYGDSLADQSRVAFSARMRQRAPGELTVSTFPGTALCDYVLAIAGELIARRPQVLVLEFSGNSFTDCMRDDRGSLLPIGSDAWRGRYLEDLRAVLKVAMVTNTSVVWATAPPVDHPGNPEDYPRRLANAVRVLAADEPRLQVADTGVALTTDGHSYRATLPCRSDEREVCADGHIVVRAADRLHFDCRGAVDRTSCAGYSAGARRYGEAMADAAIAAG